MTHLLKNRWAKYLVQALAVALVIAGTVFYIAGQKSITISVDGESKVVTTRAATVASVLEQQDIALGERDEISVATDAPVVDAQKIEIKRNKSVQVNLDGTERVVHTTGMTVADLVEELDLEKGAEISMDESQNLAAVASDIKIITPKTVTLLVDKKKTEASTTAQTVKELLAEQGVSLGDDDEVNVKVKKDTEKDVETSTKIADGQQIEVIKVSIKTWDETRDIAFETEKVKDKNLAKGKTKVETKGEKGERELTLRQETRNGKKGEEEVLKAKVTKKPVAEVVKVGTKEEKKEEKKDSSSKVTKAPSGSVSANWAALAKCESGGNWSINTGNGYYGGLQFSASSWRAVGGTKYAPLPHQATPAEQVAAAEKLRASGGWGHWPACSSKLGLR
ncbi:transglycosylase family protein [Glutamicibacter protophormiae]|uniref:transglycosylase family protein n=1 Tax=Glutamicibacter protophormiae TaxID=37930 RepID=UPI002A82E981|nr:transglycosylase family protein [Glutamicibacter protophormiae]WPR65541.1 transglycosylase family protein [Glutamicibacter protophormiae]WPR69039.1 transglycosylase family protein [Glutamicibacter protophormiae]